MFKQPSALALLLGLLPLLLLLPPSLLPLELLPSLLLLLLPLEPPLLLPSLLPLELLALELLPLLLLPSLLALELLLLVLLPSSELPNSSSRLCWWWVVQVPAVRLVGWRCECHMAVLGDPLVTSHGTCRLSYLPVLRTDLHSK